MGRGFLIAIISVVALTFPVVAQTSYEQEKDCSNLSAPDQYPDYGGLPGYEIVRKEYDASKPPVLLLRIWIKGQKTYGASVIRVGCTLASEFPQESSIYALIFDDKKAARSLAPGFTDQLRYGDYLWHLRGQFQWDNNKHQGSLVYALPEYKDGLLVVDRVTTRLTMSKR